MEKEILFPVLFPDESILLIEFYNSDTFKRCLFNDIEYEIIGEDDVKNFIGINSDKKVYYLDTDSNISIYMASDAETLVRELELYKNYSMDYKLPENPSDEELEVYANDFRQKLEILDPVAFNNENTFWSVILEQMETEQL